MHRTRDTTLARRLPSTDRVLRAPPVSALLSGFERDPVVRLTRRVLQEYRDGVLTGQTPPDLQTVAEEVSARARHEWVPGPRPVINATGVVLHTNLGRAPVSSDALAAMARAGSYGDLEYDVRSGGRGSRQDHVGRLLLSLFDADSAYVVTNNAAAVTLILATLARGKEVIVSRGQAVEIGGGFRVPVILRQSGARLVDVGTTNRTRLSDYEDAISPRTAAILHVHSSNFRIVGFAESAALPDLAALAHRFDLPLIDDNGSGSLIDTQEYGLAHEPMPAESLAAGADVVAFSGDKLLGGPQAGIILGRAQLLARLARHPLARAMRADKFALAALSATLLAYIRGDALSSLPLWRAITQTAQEIHMRALHFQEAARACGVDVDVRAGESPVGGGSLPGEMLPTALVVLPSSVTASALRACNPPVIGRTHGNRVLLDLRTVPQEEERTLLNVVCGVAPRVDLQERPMLDSGTQ